MAPPAVPVTGRGPALALALAAAAHAATFLGTGPVDDDFIVHRYARQLLEGNGLLYTAGAERVEGFTAPLWVLLSALGQLLRVPVEAWSVGLGVAASAATAFLLARAWRGGFPAPALLAAASPALAWHAVAGLGTVPLAFLVTLWFASAQRAAGEGGSLVPAALSLGLAGLMRQEAVLLAVPWIALEGARSRRWTPLLALVPAALWTLFRLAYYGRFLPITYEVKKLPVARDLAHGADYLLYSTAQTGIAAWVALALVLAARVRGPDATLVRAAAAGVFAHTLYVVWVGGDYLELARFHVPVLPLSLLLACRAGRELLGTRARLLAPIAVALALVLQGGQSARPELRAEAARHFARWRALGEHFRDAVPPGTTVALSPIGLFGWESRLPIVDVLGVTNTAVAEAPPDPAIALKGHHRHAGKWIVAQRPDVVILGNGVWSETPRGRPHLAVLPWERSIWEDPAFQREYEPRTTPVRGSDPLLFFLRRGATPPAGSRAM